MPKYFLLPLDPKFTASPLTAQDHKISIIQAPPKFMFPLCQFPNLPSISFRFLMCVFVCVCVRACAMQRRLALSSFTCVPTLDFAHFPAGEEGLSRYVRWPHIFTNENENQK